MWLERGVSADRIKVLEKDMEDLQRDIEDINDTREEGIYRESCKRPRTRLSLARRIAWVGILL